MCVQVETGWTLHNYRRGTRVNSGVDLSQTLRKRLCIGQARALASAHRVSNSTVTRNRADPGSTFVITESWTHTRAYSSCIFFSFQVIVKTLAVICCACSVYARACALGYTPLMMMIEFIDIYITCLPAHTRRYFVTALARHHPPPPRPIAGCRGRPKCHPVVGMRIRVESIFDCPPVLLAY